MRYYLYLLAAAVCEAGVITMGVGHAHFPNFQAVYHGHGATSYQNVQVDNHDSVPVSANYVEHAEIPDFEHHADLDHHSAIIPIVETHNDVDHIDISDSAPYEEFTVADIELKSDMLEHYLDHYDEAHSYDFHLQK